MMPYISRFFIVNFFFYSFFHITSCQGTPLHSPVHQSSTDKCHESISPGIRSQSFDKFGHKFVSNISDIPFVVQITVESEGVIKAKCVGSLIDPSWVITSSSCVEGIGGITGKSFKISSGLDFGDEYIFKTPKHEVSQVLVSSPDDSVCSPLMLFLTNPLNLPFFCLPPSEHSYQDPSSFPSSSRAVKGAAIGWSSYGGTDVTERNLRISGVLGEKRHCLEGRENESENNPVSCIHYQPHVHFYLLPGSPLITKSRLDNTTLIIEGIACSNLTTVLVQSNFVYRQTYLRLFPYLDSIADITGRRHLPLSSFSSSTYSTSSSLTTVVVQLSSHVSFLLISTILLRSNSI